MKKRSVLLIILFYWLAGCSANHHIQVKEENGLNTLRLVQSLHGRTLKETGDVARQSGPKINFNYLYEQKDKVRPIITLRLKQAQSVRLMTDSALTIRLGDEDISLFSEEGQYIIPENLWIPIVHSSSIHYKLKRENEAVEITLNDKERDQLTEFFNRAIKHREDIFPALPEGQKKW